MKILVIGASGMLAGPVIQKLDEKGFDLRLFSRNVKPSMFINDYEIIQGDLYNSDDLGPAMDGCDAVHISISGTDDAKATKAILEVAKEKKIKLISVVSGCTVSEENRWFSFIDMKFRAEQLIMESGIPYYIFRPTWFFESLSMMVRKGRASILGHPKGTYHWVAADDLGRMVANAYTGKVPPKEIIYVYGPEEYGMKELLEKYCERLYPEIKSVSTAPIPLLKVLAFLTRNRTLKFAASLFGYFEKVEEPEISPEEQSKAGKAEIDFDAWIGSQSQKI